MERVTAVDSTALAVAKDSARELREGINGLSPLQKAVASSQIAAVTRLVKAVEAL